MFKHTSSVSISSCPVCNRRLDEFGGAEEQEMHVRDCLEGGSNTLQAAKYLVYKLPAESALIGNECQSLFLPALFETLLSCYQASSASRNS
jgi:hypothetical protein